MMRSTSRKMAVLFSGGGAQYVGMGREAHERYPEVKQLFEQASDICSIDFQRLCFHGPMDELSDMAHSQTAIYLLDMVMYKVYQLEIGLLPTFVAGHSLGQYAALTAAGVLSAEAGFELIKQRGLLLQEAGNDQQVRMATVSKADRSEVERVCKEITANGATLEIATVNSAEQFTLSGEPKAIQKSVVHLERLGAEVVVLPISAPSHSSLMQPFQARWAEELDQWTFSPPRIPFVSNVSGKLVHEPSEIRSSLVQHLCEPVEWEKSMHFLVSQGVEMVVEAGPQSILKRIMHFIDPEIAAYAMDEAEDIQELIHFLGHETDPYGHVLDLCLRNAVSTPNLSETTDRYQSDVADPIAALRSLKVESRERSGKPSLLEGKEAVSLLKKIFDGKALMAEESKLRMNEVEILLKRYESSEAEGSHD